MVFNQDYSAEIKLLNAEMAKRQTLEFYAEKCLRVLNEKDSHLELIKIKQMTEKNILFERKYLNYSRFILTVVSVASVIFGLYALIFKPYKYENMMAIATGVALFSYCLNFPHVKTHSEVEFDFFKQIFPALCRE